MPQVAFAVWLSARMRERGYLSNRDLARASGVSDSVISRWLTSDAVPTVAQLRRLVGPVETSLLDLLVAAGHLTVQERGQAADRASVETALAGEGLDPDLDRLVLTALRSARLVQQARDGRP